LHPDVEELRSKLKEILYDCAVEIRATKAALYLLDTATKKYELVTEFGFRSAVRQSAGENDPMVDRCARGRSPFYVNTAGAEPRLSQLLFEASTERLMGVPIFSRGTLVGFIDMRDKAQKQQFDQLDVSKAQNIADRILGLFATKNIWNQRFITMSDEISIPQQPAASPAPPPAAQPAPPVIAAVPPPSRTAPSQALPQRESNASKIVAAAHALIPRLMSSTAEVIGPAEIAAIVDTLRSVLLLPAAIAAAFSATGTSGGVQEVASRGTLTQDALSALQLKFQTWLSKRGESGANLRTTLRTPLGLTMQPITPVQLQKIFTAPVVAGNIRGLYLTVAFSEPPERNTHEMLAAALNQLQTAIESSMMRTALQTVRTRIAERLVQPEFTSYPELRRHAFNVLEVTTAFADFLGLTPAESELAKLTAIVHDCGMRVLDYERLYRKASLSHEELALLKEHVVVGAAMVEPLLGPEVARAVLGHHERVDGAGYPGELKGEEIPLASRVLQICDVYVAITDPATYQTPESVDDALSAIRRGAGTQFDEHLALRFDEMMRGRAQSTKLAGR
jgi:HD domain/GAF domain